MSSDVNAGIIFREAEEDDSETILQVMKDLLQAQGLSTDKCLLTVEGIRHDGFGDNKAFTCILVEDVQADGSKKTVGFALYCYMYITFTGRAVWLEDLYVCEEYRRREIGRNLMRHVAKVAVKQNCTVMCWCTLGSNVKGHRFYKRCGGVNLTTNEDCHIFRLDNQELKDLAAENISENIKQCVD